MFDRNYVKERFKNHKATVKFYDNITVLDFKNPNSNEYRIRFLFENDYYRLHISGDLGELTATNFNNMTYEKFNDFVRDVGYFEKKIDCHSRLICFYSEESIRNDVIALFSETGSVEEFIENYKMCNYELSADDDAIVLNKFFDELLYDYSTEQGLTDRARKLLAIYLTDETDAWGENIGKRATGILEWYLTAFQLAQEQLKK